MVNSYQFGSPLLRWTSLFFLLLTGQVWAQSGNQFVVQGHVTDASGQGVPGVTVQLKGTTLGTTSVADGSYTLNVNTRSGPHTLVFTSVGYKADSRTLSPGNAGTITLDVSLAEDNQTLDEVVVVGSTVTTTRRQLGNAISTIRAQDIQQSGSGGLLNSLQGKVPGAQITQNSGDPAGSISVKLRGVKSLAGPSDPLYVIDGVIVRTTS